MHPGRGLGERRARNTRQGSSPVMDHPFAGIIIRAVLACYAVWGAVTITDLAACERRTPGRCEPQRAEVRSVATAIPATLLAWLADSPITGKATAAPRQSASRTPAKKPEGIDPRLDPQPMDVKK